MKKRRKKAPKKEANGILPTLLFVAVLASCLFLARLKRDLVLKPTLHQIQQDTICYCTEFFLKNDPTKQMHRKCPKEEGEERLRARYGEIEVFSVRVHCTIN